MNNEKKNLHKTKRINVSVQYLSVYCTLTLHHVIECTRNVPNGACDIECTVVNKK